MSRLEMSICPSCSWAFSVTRSSSSSVPLRTILLCVCLPACLPVCLSVHQSVRPSIHHVITRVLGELASYLFIWSRSYRQVCRSFQVGRIKQSIFSVKWALKRAPGGHWSAQPLPCALDLNILCGVGDCRLDGGRSAAAGMERPVGVG
jgi:hypothetical protein